MSTLRNSQQHLTTPFLQLTPTSASGAHFGAVSSSSPSSFSSSASASSSSSSAAPPSAFLDNEAAVLAQEKEFDRQVLLPMLRDKSPAARAGRRRMFIRAVLGEFFATLFFFFFVMAVSVNLVLLNVPVGTTVAVNSLAAMMGSVATIYSFSEISGAHFNPAVTFAVWLIGKTSNRKFLFFILAQFLGINFAMLLIYLAFDAPSAQGYSSVFDVLAIRPVSSNLGHVFFMEFLLTFLLIAVIFLCVLGGIEAEQKNQLSLKGLAAARGLTIYHAGGRAGFAPLAIGFGLGALVLIGGSVSGGCFNPCRLFSSALWSGVWEGHWAYWLGQFSGAAAAAGLNIMFGKMGLGQGETEETFKHDRRVPELATRELNEHGLPDGQQPESL